MQEQSHFVIANPAGVKQSSDMLGKIASSGEKRPPRNDKCDSEQGEGRVAAALISKLPTLEPPKIQNEPIPFISIIVYSWFTNSPRSYLPG
jgi:hypothetical protein